MKVFQYSVGFVGSLLLTLAAYILATATALSKPMVIVVITVLALIQLFVQLVFFLHIGYESAPKHKLRMFVAMASVLSIVIFGSVWIMSNLNYHMMTPSDMNSHMLHERQKGF